jgi:predicted transcriptional regulator
VLKLVQIMHDKGYVRRDETRRPLVYHPSSTEQQTQKLLLRDLMERVFGGSARSMIAQILALKRATPDEIGQIRDQLDKMSKAKA